MMQEHLGLCLLTVVGVEFFFPFRQITTVTGFAVGHDHVSLRTDTLRCTPTQIA
jgi:hypothetical protein